MKEILSIFTFNKDDYDRVKKDVWIENWHRLCFFSGIAVIAFGTMAVVSVFSSSIGRNLLLYVVYGFIALLFFGVSHYKVNSIKVKELFVYSFFTVLLSFGIVMGTIISPQDLTVSYIVLMIAVPLLFTARSCVINGLVLLSMMIYIGLASFTQDNLIFTYNLLKLRTCFLPMHLENSIPGSYSVVKVPLLCCLKL